MQLHAPSERDVSATTSEVCLLSESDVLGRIPVHRSTLWRRIQDGTFPKPISLGDRSFWRSDEVTAYIDWLTQQSRP